jgi:HSP20 family molecular chaperone IbpA
MSHEQLDKISSEPASSNTSQNGLSQRAMWRVQPRCDLYESDSGYLLVVDLPGATAESLSIQIVGTELQLRAQRATGSPSAPEGSDIAVTAFERRIELPAEVDAASGSAKLESGILEIRVAKAASARRVQIPINTN